MNRWRILLKILGAFISGGVAAAEEFKCQALPASGLFAPIEHGWTTGKKRMLVYPVRFADTPSDPATASEIRATLELVNERLTRFSYNNFSIEAEITPALQLEHEGRWYRERGFNSILFEARSLAEKAGFKVDDYHLDAAHCHPIEGWFSGQANLGGKGAVVHYNNPSLYVHELGHNLGLFHANAWEHSRPPLLPRSSPPFPSNVHEHAEPFVFEPGDLVGHGDIRSHGASIEYGDPFDTMGGGEGDFSPAFKKRIGWLEGTQHSRVSTNGVYRLFAYDAGIASTNRLYSIALEPVALARGGNANYRYWISYRQTLPSHAEAAEGLELRWVDEAESYVTHLLDTRPGTSRLIWDALLPVGRSFTDHELNLRITALRAGEEEGRSWIDVAIHFGASAPAVELEVAANSTRVAQGEPVTFQAQSSGAAAFFWDFGDGTVGHGPAVEKSWKAAGKHIVKCEATDGKGPPRSKTIEVIVGAASGFSVSGIVQSPEGRPLPGALVHNGRITAEAGMLPEFKSVETDSDGRFTLANLESGSYQIGAQAYGHTLRALQEERVEIRDRDVTNVTFIATSWAEVHLASAKSSVAEGESIEITLIRTGELTNILEAALVISGQAVPGADYAVEIPRRIVFPAGISVTNVLLHALPDLDEEPLEEVRITAVPAPERAREWVSRGVTNRVTFHYPGWEPSRGSGGEVWVQTLPGFTRTERATTAFVIEDRTPRGIQRVSLFAEDGQLYEAPLTGARVRFSRLGSVAEPLEVHYSVGGTAENGADYERLSGVITIPAGAPDIVLMVMPIADGVLEEIETIQLSLVERPVYRIEGSAAAELFLNEDLHNSGPNRLEFATQWDGSLVVNIRGRFGETYVLERSLHLAGWEAVSTNELTFSPTSVRVPEMTEPRLFYRSRSWQSPARPPD